MLISIGILMNQRRIPYWSGWPIQDLFERKIHFWIMDVEKAELMFLDEIDCNDLFSGNDPQEKIVIFEL